MTKRSSVRLLSFGLLLAGILIIYAITGTVQAAQYRARLESTYRQSLSALAEDLEGIETDLTKSVYANGMPPPCLMSAEICLNRPIRPRTLCPAYRWSR